MTEKKCTGCGEVKPLSAYYRSPSGKNGLQSQCKSCHSVMNRTYRKNHRVEIAAQRRAFREENRDEINARQRSYYRKNREHIAARAKAYRDANKGKLAEIGKRYRESHREEARERDRERRELIGEPTVEKYRKLAAQFATTSGRWSDSEDAYIAASTDRIIDDALALGRKFDSVRTHICVLRARGVVLARDGVSA